MRPHSRCSFVAGAALALLGSLAPPTPLPAQEPGPGYEEALFELVLPRVAERLTTAALVDSAGRLFLPLHPVVQFAEVPARSAGDTLVLEWPPGEWSTRVNLRTREVARGGAVDTVAPADWVTRNDEVFVAVAALSRILAATTEVDWTSVTLTLSGATDFPAVRKLDLAARRNLERLADGGLLPRGEPAVAYPARSGGWVANWGLAAALSSGGTHGSARAVAGAALLGGAVEAGATATIPPERSELGDGFVRYTRAFPERKWIRQARAGDVFSDGLLGRRLLGVVLSNEPYYLPQYFGEVVVEPVLPAGWEFEVYQGDHLVGVSTPQSPGPVAAPLGYGNSPIRVRLVGPAGQEQLRELTYLVPAAQLPPGDWRYFLGAGRCLEAACERFGYVDVRRGLTPNLTLGAGLDREERTGTSATRPYGIMVVRPGRAMNAELRGRLGSFVRAALQGTSAGGESWNATVGWTVAEERTLGQPAWYLQSGGSAPLWGGRWTAVQLRMQGIGAGRVDAWRASATSAFSRANLALAYEHGLQRRSILSARAFSSLRDDPRLRARDATVFAALGASSAGAELAEAGGTLRAFRGSILSLGLRWQRGGGAPSVTLGVVARTPGAYLQSRASGGPGGACCLPRTGGLRTTRNPAPWSPPSGASGRAESAGGCSWTPPATADSTRNETRRCQACRYGSAQTGWFPTAQACTAPGRCRRTR